MDRLRCLEVFYTVVQSGSFSRAAGNLSLSKPTVTKHVAALEATLGAQLLNRTTKSIALTEDGKCIFAAAGDMLKRYEEMRTELGESVNALRGVVRVGTPPSFGAYHLTSVIAQFSARFPEIEIIAALDDGRADLVAESLDLSIRIVKSLDDASYVAQPLSKAPQVLVASPDYIRNSKAVDTVESLSNHRCLVHTIKNANAVWRFPDATPSEVRVNPAIRSNLGDVLKQMAILGAGISMHPHYMVSEELRTGALEAVLPAFRPEELDIHVIFSTRRNMPARVRNFLDFLKKWAKQPNPWRAHAGRASSAADKPWQPLL